MNRFQWHTKADTIEAQDVKTIANEYQTEQIRQAEMKHDVGIPLEMIDLWDDYKQMQTIDLLIIFKTLKWHKCQIE